MIHVVPPAALDKLIASARTALIRAARGGPVVSSMAVMTIAGCHSSDCASIGDPDDYTCGNGTVEANEDCEPGVAFGATCASATGYPGSTGNLACYSCYFDTSRCSSPSTGGASGAGGQNFGGGAGGSSAIDASVDGAPGDAGDSSTLDGTLDAADGEGG